MDMNSSVNPSTISGNVVINIEPPPPYYNQETITTQPPPTVHESVVRHNRLKNKPSFQNCPKCEQRVLTRVEYINSRKTHLCAGFIGGLTLWCFLCCLAAIPYLMKSCKKAYHYCPNCETFLGAYSRV